MDRKLLFLLLLTAFLGFRSMGCLIDLEMGSLLLPDGTDTESAEEADSPDRPEEALDGRDGVDRVDDGDALHDVDADREGPCVDNDGDGYGTGEGCLGPDCDDTLPACNEDCLDHDGDGMIDCHVCPSNPTYAGSIDTPGSAWYVDIANDYAYVADRTGGLKVIDVAGLPPLEVGSYALDPGPSYFSSVQMTDPVAFIADETAGLVILSIVDPYNPLWVSVLGITGNAYDVSVVGAYAYIAADSPGGLIVADISDNSAPVEISARDTAGDARGIQAAGSYAYVADGNNGLVIFDVSEPAHPVLAGTYTPAPVCYVQHAHRVSGSYAFIACQAGGLQILDVSNPASPVFVSGFDTTGTANGVFEQNGIAYVADGGAGLRVIDADDIFNPVEIGFYDTPGNAWKVKVVKGYAYVADGDSGLQVISLLCQ